MNEKSELLYDKLQILKEDMEIAKAIDNNKNEYIMFRNIRNIEN